MAVRAVGTWHRTGPPATCRTPGARSPRWWPPGRTPLPCRQPPPSVRSRRRTSPRRSRCLRESSCESPARARTAAPF
ncbi:MAG: hypothetical protein DYG92_05990 [Leptolyngbya sp. PLA1]|nr:hypothetical protein [Leptolyngbya sp. PLA1]